MTICVKPKVNGKEIENGGPCLPCIPMHICPAVTSVIKDCCCCRSAPLSGNKQNNYPNNANISIKS